MSGIPFEYVAGDGMITRQPSGLYAVVRRIENHTQKFRPAVLNGVTQFIADMTRLGTPIQAILTAGSLYCRCIRSNGRNTNSLSDHSHGEAIDIVGVRWSQPRAVAETIVHNFQHTGERALLRRMNACLRLLFPRVIDYHRADHRDHFHCDMNRGRGRNPRESSTLSFAQEALTVVLGRNVPVTGRLDAATQKALMDFSGLGPDAISNTASLNRILDQLFARIVSGS